jgi:S-DNA-T family DNA segregation ATPase FtsK/SpoIIIE
MPSRKSQRKRTPQRTRDGVSKPQSPPLALDRALQREIGGVLLVALGGVTALALLSITRGTLSAAWVLFLRRIFGWGAHFVVLAMIAAGVLLLWDDLRHRLSAPLRSIVSLEVLLVAVLGLSHLFVATDKSLQTADQGHGGGYIGWAISYLLITTLGRTVALVLLLAAVVTSVILLLSPTWDDVRLMLGKVKARLGSMAPPAEPPPETMGETPRVVLKERKRFPKPPVGPSAPLETRTVAAPSPGRRLRRDRSLPSLDLLNGGSDEPYGEADIRYRRQVIEETLGNFGIPAKVVEVHQGPTVTQFGVEPGFLQFTGADGEPKLRKIRISKIMALQDDLSLALAASPIRIEAPVPGRSVVGIEVPNVKASLVSLRSVVDSKAFRSIDSWLRIALGKDVAGQPVAADLAEMPHLLIAGATGSGKSVCINAITACLLLDNTPDELRLLMVDPKMVELTNFNGIPHLLAPVITDVEEVVRALRWVTKQMDERYRLFSDTGTRNIDAYNRLMASREHDKLPQIVVLIDELADLMLTAPDEIERHICRIAQLARATGIHLVIATQRPSVDVITGLIKANFPARISFATTTQVDSRVILDTAGAEKLLGRGDMLYMASDSSKLQRLQGCFVSDDELERLVKFWTQKIDWIAPQPAAPAPWQDIAFEEDEGSDELLAQAIELARGRGSISTSFIQRQLRIGYPRAAHLIDLMEEQGIVGPAEDGGRSRQVLSDEDYDLEEDEDDELA